MLGGLLERRHLKLKILVECTARAIKHLLRRKLSASNPDRQTLMSVISEFLSTIVGPRTRTFENSEGCVERSNPRIPVERWVSFWQYDVPADIEKCYGNDTLTYFTTGSSAEPLFDTVRPFMDQIIETVRCSTGIKFAKCTERFGLGIGGTSFADYKASSLVESDGSVGYSFRGYFGSHHITNYIARSKTIRFYQLMKAKSFRDSQNDAKFSSVPPSATSLLSLFRQRTELAQDLSEDTSPETKEEMQFIKFIKYFTDESLAEEFVLSLGSDLDTLDPVQFEHEVGKHVKDALSVLSLDEFKNALTKALRIAEQVVNGKPVAKSVAQFLTTCRDNRSQCFLSKAEQPLDLNQENENISVSDNLTLDDPDQNVELTLDDSGSGPTEVHLSVEDQIIASQEMKDKIEERITDYESGTSEMEEQRVESSNHDQIIKELSNSKEIPFISRPPCLLRTLSSGSNVDVATLRESKRGELAENDQRLAMQYRCAMGNDDVASLSLVPLFRQSSVVSPRRPLLHQVSTDTSDIQTRAQLLQEKLDSVDTLADMGCLVTIERIENVTRTNLQQELLRARQILEQRGLVNLCDDEMTRFHHGRGPRPATPPRNIEVPPRGVVQRRINTVQERFQELSARSSIWFGIVSREHKRPPHFSVCNCLNIIFY
jgi:hypothetical protein